MTHLIRTAKIQKNLVIPHASNDVEQQECSSVACGNVKCNYHVGSQFGSFFQIQMSSHRLTQPLHS